MYQRVARGCSWKVQDGEGRTLGSLEGRPTVERRNPNEKVRRVPYKRNFGWLVSWLVGWLTLISLVGKLNFLTSLKERKRERRSLTVVIPTETGKG